METFITLINIILGLGAVWLGIIILGGLLVAIASIIILFIMIKKFKDF